MFFTIFVPCVILLTIFPINVVTFAKLPNEIQKCHRHDSDCITKTTNFIIKKYSKTGYPEMGLPPIEPFPLSHIYYGGQPNNPISLSMNMTDIKLYGVSDFIFQNLSGFEKNLRDSRIYNVIYAPKLILKCKSELSGKILTIPIKSNGLFEAVIYNLTLQLREKLESEMVDGEEVAHIAQYKFSPKIDKMVLKIDTKNLFNGDQSIGENFLKVINDNWEPLWDDIANPIFAPFVKKIIETIDKILTSIPYKDIFLPDE